MKKDKETVEERKKRYYENSNKKIRERYRNDEDYRKKRLERNRTWSYKNSDLVKKRNAKNNAINNPIYNAKRKQQNDTLQLKRAITQGNQLNDKVLTEEDLNAVVEKIAIKIDALRKNNEHFKFYIGATGQAPKNEAFQWLSKRGKPAGYRKDGTPIQGSSKQRNRPVLLKKNNATIKMKEARDKYFEFKVLFESALDWNVLKVEEKLQLRYQELELGTERLWRCVAKGGNTLANTSVKSTFITYSTQSLQEMGLKVNK